MPEMDFALEGTGAGISVLGIGAVALVTWMDLSSCSSAYSRCIGFCTNETNAGESGVFILE